MCQKLKHPQTYTSKDNLTILIDKLLFFLHYWLIGSFRNIKESNITSIFLTELVAVDVEFFYV